MYRGPLDTIVLTTISGKSPADVICFHSPVSWNAFKEYADRMDIGYTKIDADTAAKILYSNGGIGYGCYTMHGVTEDYYKVKQYRMASARVLKRDIAAYTGICSIFEPLEVSVTIEATQEPDSAVEAL